MSRVEIYTSPFCMFCHRAKALLREKGIAFDEIDVAAAPGKRGEMVARAGGRRTVPQIFVDGVHLGDCEGLLALERAGRLDALLRGAGAAKSVEKKAGGAA